jgi:hypothetical protein
VVEQCEYNSHVEELFLVSTVLVTMYKLFETTVEPSKISQSNLASIDHSQHIQTLLPARPTTSPQQSDPKSYPPFPFKGR